MNSIKKVAVLGLYASGTSALAQVLENLGVFMGPELCPTYGESKDLAYKMKGWWAEPALIESQTASRRIRELAAWLKNAEEIREQSFDYEMVGTAHALLTLCGPELLTAWGSDTRFIWSFRDLEDSITSLSKRGWFRGKEVRMQQRLWDAAVNFLATQDHLIVKYDSLISQPAHEIDQVIDFLGLDSGEDQINRAIQSIKNPKPELVF